MSDFDNAPLGNCFQSVISFEQLPEAQPRPTITGVQGSLKKKNLVAAENG